MQQHIRDTAIGNNEPIAARHVKPFDEARYLENLNI